MNARVRGRFAPSPSGPLHIGNLRTALLAWLDARGRNGEFVLRIEDLDQSRVCAEPVETMVSTLRWMGLDWDEGPDVGGPYAPYVQSQRSVRYQDAIGKLRSADLLYPCYCSKADITQAAGAPHEETKLTCNTDACRDPSRRQHLANRHPERQPAYRFRSPDCALTVVDDFVVVRRDGTPSYQLAVVVDDAEMNITRVVRGSDLRLSALRQTLLYRALNWPVPLFHHVPLVVNEQGRKMSKGDKCTAESCFDSPRSLVGALAASVGLAPIGQHLTPLELLATYDAGDPRLRPSLLSFFDSRTQQFRGRLLIS